MPASPFLSPLTIFVVWHPAYPKGAEIAAYIYHLFSRDLTNSVCRGIGIPVFFRSAVPEGQQFPPPIDNGDADRSIVIAIIDEYCAVEWTPYLEQIQQQCDVIDNGAVDLHRFIPVALFSDAYRVSPLIREQNFINLFAVPAEDQHARLKMILTHELCRLLLNKPRISRAAVANADQIEEDKKILLFLSYARRDGQELTEQIKAHINAEVALNTFLDKVDIAPGKKFSEVLHARIHDSTLLIILTDAYASREWCRWEVLEAKRSDRPVVVVNAIRELEERSFPYIGNVPVIRYDPSRSSTDMLSKIITTTLFENLRYTYSKLLIAAISDLYCTLGDVHKVLGSPPELLTMVGKPTRGENSPLTVLYPDPPLTSEERELLAELDQYRFITPATLPLHIELTESTNELEGKQIGLSISDSPDLGVLGFSLHHLMEANLEVARYLLYHGCSLAYGGDLRHNGFTEQLLLLCDSYTPLKEENKIYLHSYLGFPASAALTMEQRAKYHNIARFIEVPLPADVIQRNADLVIEDATAEARYSLFRSMTAVRQTMNQEIHARVIVGGQTTTSKSRYPGIVEEAYLALQSNLPVYLCGAFGGAARAVIDALQGKEICALGPNPAADPVYAGAVQLYNQRHPEQPINYTCLLEYFRSKGVEGLNNGLTTEENQVLFETPYIPQLVSLLLKGMRKVFGGTKRKHIVPIE